MKPVQKRTQSISVLKATLPPLPHDPRFADFFFNDGKHPTLRLLAALYNPGQRSPSWGRGVGFKNNSRNTRNTRRA